MTTPAEIFKPLTDDHQIDKAVREALTAKMPKAARNIKVTVEQGAIHLWGVLGSDEELTELPKIVATVPGVRAVCDHRKDLVWPD